MTLKKSLFIERYGIDAWEKKLEAGRKWHAQNKERNIQTSRAYREEHKEERKEYLRQYRDTPIGKAGKLLNDYQRADRKHDRKCNLTADWIVKRIFSRPCIYCGSTENIGCDRVNNSIGHLTWNVQPSCPRCNIERQRQDFFTFRQKKWKERGKTA